MSRFSGPQQRGAMRRFRAARRRAAAWRQHADAVRREADARSCPGKIRFATVELALARLASINALKDDEMRAYDCTACGWIHLGHAPGEATGRRNRSSWRSTPERGAA